MKLIYIANSRIPTEKAHGFQIAKMCESFSRAGAETELWLPSRINTIKENIPSKLMIIGRTIAKITKLFNGWLGVLCSKAISCFFVLVIFIIS